MPATGSVFVRIAWKPPGNKKAGAFAPATMLWPRFPCEPQGEMGSSGLLWEWLSNADHAALHVPDQPLPVCPNPPAPRSVSPSSSTSTTDGLRIGTSTAWAIRSPCATV